MSSAGVSREGGASLTDFDHVRQSIGVILTTPIGSRVMRRDFGSELFDLTDRPMTDQVILAVYAAAAMAIARWEPRFSVTSFQLSQADEQGQIALALFGEYFPRGHVGDFTLREKASMRITLG